MLTQKTQLTTKIVQLLHHTSHTSTPNFLISSDLKFSTKLLSMIIIAIYIAYKSKIKLLSSTLKNNLKPILICSILNLINKISFYKSYNLFSNKVNFLSLLKLELPILLLLSYIILYEKISIRKIIGSTIIVIANLMLLLSQTTYI